MKFKTLLKTFTFLLGHFTYRQKDKKAKSLVSIK